MFALAPVVEGVDRTTAATRNVLSGIINLTAVLMFLASGEVRWPAMAVVIAGELAWHPSAAPGQ
jgi:hypothetical protein